MKLFLSFHSSIEFDDTFYDNSYTISVLSVGDIKYRGTVLNLVGEEGKIYPRSSYEVGKGLRPDLTYKRFELFKLFLYKRRSPKFYEVVGLRTSTIKRDYTILAFVNTFV